MTAQNLELSFLQQQLSVPAAELVEPAPNPEQLNAILQSAMSAPDHGELHPYRFLVIQGDARQELSKVFEAAVQTRLPEADQATIDKQKSKPLRSPMIVTVVACLNENPKIPEVEQLLTAGCAAQHIQLACRSLGFGSIWLTGDNCYDSNVHQALGLEFNERIVGFIYIGTPKSDQRLKQRPKANARTEYWRSPQAIDFAI